MLFHEKLRESVMLYRDSPAIVCDDCVISYGDLDKRSDEIAFDLMSQGARRNALVPIHRELDADWIAYSLGVLKTGAVYVPISPSTPPERVDFILRDISAENAFDDAMLVYYTSGSTGEPKGVVLSHGGVLSLCETHCKLCGFSRGTKAAVQADVGFDSFLLSTLPVLYAGGTLYLMNGAERVSLTGVHRFLMKHKIETVFLTTKFAVEYMRAFDNPYLKTLLTGGEALRSYTPRSYAVYNLYGPTECTVYVTAHKLTEKDSGDIPIGAPTGENLVYLDGGELCVSGPQVALGYLGQHPFGGTYRTGDLAEWGENGELYYRGRLDNQVKISGYRIEPGEIETALLKHPDVTAACVSAEHKPDGEVFLAAYYVPRTKEIAPETLKAFLSHSLPPYMIPRRFVMLERLPLDERTGKVNRSILRTQ